MKRNVQEAVATSAQTRISPKAEKAVTHLLSHTDFLKPDGSALAYGLLAFLAAACLWKMATAPVYDAADFYQVVRKALTTEV